MSVTTALNACPHIQEELNDLFSSGNSSRILEPSPLSDFIMSPANESLIQYEIVPGRGEIKTIEARYDQRLLATEVLDNVTNPTCTATTKRGDIVSIYTLDPAYNVGVEELWDVADWALTCRDNPRQLAVKIQLLIDAVVRKTYYKNAVQFNTMVSTAKWASDVSNVVDNFLEVSTLRASSVEDPSTIAVRRINNAKMQTSYSQGTVLVGGLSMYEYYQVLKAGCCSQYGVSMDQLLQQYGEAVYYDKYVVAATGDQNISWLAQLGSVAMVQYSANEAWDGINMLDIGSDYNPMVIVDPRTGLKMDMNISIKCGKIHLQLVATNKLIVLPSDMFQVGDNLRGVQWINRIKVVNT